MSIVESWLNIVKFHDAVESCRPVIVTFRPFLRGFAPVMAGVSSFPHTNGGAAPAR